MIKTPSPELIPFCVSYTKVNNPHVLQIDPFQNKYYNFTEAMLMIDRYGFSEKDMVMARWVFYDCAMIPGIAVGYGVKNEDAPQAVKDFYKMDLELYPLSMFILIPTLEAGTFFAHNLCSINQALPGLYKGLAQYSKALGLSLMKAKYLMGPTQWNSDSLYVHMKFGEMEILSAATKLHGTPYTLTYKVKIAKDPFDFRTLDGKGANVKVGIEDLASQEEIHESILSGKERYFMLTRDATHVYLKMVPN